jgi:hypothetical protein
MQRTHISNPFSHIQAKYAVQRTSLMQEHVKEGQTIVNTLVVKQESLKEY